MRLTWVAARLLMTGLVQGRSFNFLEETEAMAAATAAEEDEDEDELFLENEDNEGLEGVEDETGWTVERRMLHSVRTWKSCGKRWL